MATFYQYSKNFELIGAVKAREDTIPPRSTKVKPLPKKEGYTQFFRDSGWEYVPINNDISASLKDSISSVLGDIDKAASEEKQKLITNTPLQMETYRLKEKEAESYIAAAYPTPADAYPMINEESHITGDSPKVVADTIIATRDGWYVALGRIEGYRIKYKRLVREVTKAADAYSLLASFKHSIQDKTPHIMK